MPKKPTAAKSRSAKSKPEEPADYIDIGAIRQNIEQKDKTLWLIVGFFAVILVLVWFAVMRYTVASQFKDINFGQLKTEISDSLARFDTEIKSRTSTTPAEVNLDDINSIKTGLENQIKNNPDSSLWPEHELKDLKVTLSYPENWLAKTATASGTILTDSQTSTAATYGRLTLNLKNNSQNYTLDAWLTKNKINPAGYEAEIPTFKFTTSSKITVYNKIQTATSSLDKIYYLNPIGNKIIEIKAEAKGDIGYYLPLINEIINTIK